MNGTHDRLLHASAAVYRSLLRAYPADFRERFGHEMEQVFRAETGAIFRRAGMAGLALAWVAHLVDIMSTSVREHGRDAALRRKPRTALSVGAVLAVCTAGSIHAYVDASVLTLIVAVAGAFICGALYSRNPVRWFLLVGMCVPLALLLHMHHLGDASRHDHDTVSVLPIVPSMLAAYLGAHVGLILARCRMTAAAATRL